MSVGKESSKDPAAPGVSVVIPCRNERERIGPCVASVLGNGYPGALEVIVVDGMSTDGTRGVLGELQARHGAVRVVDNQSTLTPVALNLGFRAARHGVVLILGAHCELGPGYIAAVTRRLLSRSDAGCAGGRTTPRVRTGKLRQAMAAALASPFGVGNAYFRTAQAGWDPRSVDTVAYGAYRKETLERVGGFDERLVRNQDIELNRRVRALGYAILLDPSVEVYYSPRPSLREFARQSFANGRWNVITWALVPGSLSWRHFVPLLFVSGLAIAGLAAILLPGLAEGLPPSLAGTLAAVCRTAFLVAASSYGLLAAAESARLALGQWRVPFWAALLVFPVLHVAYGAGSASGLAAVLTGVRRSR